MVSKDVSFKFSTREEYEHELARLVAELDDSGYEELADEYVDFCDSILEKE